MPQRLQRSPALLILAIAGVLLCNMGAQPTLNVKASPQAQEFLRIAGEELAARGECTKAAAYLRGLPPKEQLQVARAILYDIDARIAYVGANILIERGLTSEAVPALTVIIASGRNETQLNGRIGYDWIHHDDQTRFLRMAVSINKYFLANLNKYSGDERSRVETTLMGGLLERSSEPFSTTRARALIAEWEKQLRSAESSSATGGR